ncbi:hypothetical protein PRIC2_009247 [Phytophthora ramorum]
MGGDGVPSLAAALRQENVARRTAIATAGSSRPQFNRQTQRRKDRAGPQSLRQNAIETAPDGNCIFQLRIGRFAGICGFHLARSIFNFELIKGSGCTAWVANGRTPLSHT